MDKEFKWKKNKWEDIEDLINRWKRRNPQGYKVNMSYNQHVRDNLKDPKYARMGGRSKNQHAVDSLSGTRLGVSIHPELISYIQSFYPNFLDSNEDVREFGRRFKNFAIPEKF